MSRGTARVAGLLFFSGACALIYQTTWLRQFRLIFGASTFATAAVLAIFMGGLGVGSALFGRRADAHPRPLAFYGSLELLIAISAALSPARLWVVGKIYFSNPSAAEGGRLAAPDGLRTRPTFAAAALVGFAFLLMELVWYRMLAPLLGGSTFTFGLILAVALLGIGLGGAAYSFWGGRRRATVGGFALTCSLEAAAMALPLALGDRRAMLANPVRSP